AELLVACPSAVGGDDNMGLDDGAVEQRAALLVGHAIEKLRAIIAANVTGAPGLQVLRQACEWNDCDLAAVQERKVPWRQRDGQGQALRRACWKVAFNPAVRAGASTAAENSLAGLSGGTMVAVPVRHGLSEVESIQSCASPARASILHLGHGPKGGMLVGTMYLCDSEGLSERNWQILCSMGRATKRAGTPFLISNDCRPSKRVINYFVMSPFLAAGAKADALDRIAIGPRRAARVRLQPLKMNGYMLSVLVQARPLDFEG
ncbi:unnamed protein product, partial [Prorocentrum cordatum]